MLKDLWNKFDKKAFYNAIKLPMRIFVFYALGIIVDFLIIEFAGATTPTGKFLFLFLTIVDKYMHEKAKNEPAKTRNEGYFGVRGLTGF